MTMNDIWDSMEVRNDKYALISEMNKEVDLFINTPVGDSEVFTLEKIEQQGTTLGPIKCSNQMDSISRECLRDNLDMYQYRNAVTIPPLGMIDDLAAVAKCGPESIILNAVINGKIVATAKEVGVPLSQYKVLRVLVVFNHGYFR